MAPSKIGREPSGVGAAGGHEGNDLGDQRSAVHPVDLQPGYTAAKEQAGRGVQQLVQGDVEPPAEGEAYGDPPEGFPAAVEAAVEAVEGIQRRSGEEKPAGVPCE